MNSELEAIMRRRRRKADGLPGSPSPRKKEPETRPRPDESPPRLPPPSSVNTTRRSKLAMRKSPILPPPAPDVAPMTPRESTRRRALDQIRGSRRTYSHSPAEDSTSPEKQQQQNDSMLASGGPNDSIMTQGAVVHGVSNVSPPKQQDESIVAGNALMDSMDVVIASPTDESMNAVASPSPEKSVQSPEISIVSPQESVQSPQESVRSPETSVVSPQESAKTSSVYSSPTKSMQSSLSSPSPAKSIRSPLSSPAKSVRSPLSPSMERKTPEASIESSVDSPMKPTTLQEEYSSSSEEQQVVPSEPLQSTEPAFSTSFGHFEADFASSFPASTEYEPPMFDNNVYEPPPVFEPMPEPVDYTPLENVPTRTAPTVLLQQSRVISAGPHYHCPPTTNPLNGNVIMCRTSNKNNSIGLHEINIDTGAQVEFTPILTDAVEKKFKATYGTTVVGIHNVISITAGVHYSQGHARVRVAALVEFQALALTGKQVSRTVLLVWQWGYGSNKPIALQSLLSPPTKASFTYDAASLQMADGVVFLSGTAKNKGPCVFCVRPYVKDVWSANLLSENVSAIAVTSHSKYKYIAIAQTDGSLSVWTFDAAFDHKGSDSPKTLFPLCRLYGASAIPKDEGTSDEKGFCTGLAWMSSGSMLLLAAAFTHGMAVYHVSLPVLKDGETIKPVPEPTASTQLSQTVLLPSFVASRWASPMEKATVSWVNIGPSPCLSFLLKKDSTVKAVMGVINLPLHGDTGEQNNLYPFTVLSSSVLSTASDDSLVTDLVGYCSVGTTKFHKSGSIMTLSPKLSTDASYFRWLRSPVMSAAPGLDSTGHVSLSDTTNDSDGILQIFAVKQCIREPTSLPSPVPDTERLDWTPPKQRYLLCQSFVGDSREAQDPSPEAQSSAEYGDIDTVTSGNYIEMICDVSVANLVPRGIVRCKGTKLCAVLLHRGVEHTDGLSTDAVLIALIDTAEGKLLHVCEGRDICFLPSAKAGEEKALVLSLDGSSVCMLRRVLSSEETNEKSTWEQSDAARTLLDVNADDEYVEGRCLHLVLSGTKAALLVSATRVRDNCSCLVLGNQINIDECDDDLWKGFIPSMTKSSTCWLEPKETVQSLVILPSHQDGSYLLAVATSSRLMLISEQMRAIVEASVKLSSPSLVPLGSHTVAYSSEDCKLRYLCSLGGKFSNGLLATLPSQRVGHDVYQLLSIRPDRFVYTNKNGGVRLVEEGEDAHTFPLPAAITKPALLLEPMVANALCECNNFGESTSTLRTVIERFGRKVAPFPHGEDEGIGTSGSGLTPSVLEMLSAHGMKHAASWLLTGSCGFERSANSRVLPPWMTVTSKAAAALNHDAYLHIIANGDQYFSDYVKSPDQNMASTLPRPSDPSAVVSHELARRAMEDGDIAGAIKMLDIAGTSTSDSALLQLALSAQLEQSTDITTLLKTLSGQGDEAYTRSASNLSTTNSLAALALDLKSRQVNGKVPQQGGEFVRTNEEFRRRYITQLAPSIQRSRKPQRVRHRLIGESATHSATAGMQKIVEPDTLWQNPCNESKHVWNEGPQKNKENLLLLDRMEEWLGRKRPAVLGKEGAEAALERGEKTLADILNKANDYDDDSFGGESVGDVVLPKDGWAEGVGEGRGDEDNLSFYLRMSEGADEDSTWRRDGFVDLTPYANKATLLGLSDGFTLQPTSSSVDEGEPGKVKLLYDLVFGPAKEGESPGGLLVEAPRGSSLDVGMLHRDAHDARRKCSVEFWFRLPTADAVTGNIVLARRSVSSPGEDVARLCEAGDNHGFLWELVLMPSGEVEFRSNGGSSMLSSGESSSEFEQNQSMGDFGDDAQNEDGGLVSWGRPDGSGGWNHVCLIFSSRNQQSLSDCTVKMFMKGTKVASMVAQIVPPGLEESDLADANKVDEAMQKSVYVFGLNAVPDYRMTEFRLWSCERSEDDIKMMMYEYLHAAETKKKFKVKIRNKRGDGVAPKSRTGGLLSPPPLAGGLLSPPPSGGSLLSPPRDGKGTKSSLLPPPRAPTSTTTFDDKAAAFDDKNFAFDASFRTFEKPDDNVAATNEKEQQLQAEANVSPEQKTLLTSVQQPPPPPSPPPSQPPRKPRTPEDARRAESALRKVQDEDSLLPASSYPPPPKVDGVIAEETMSRLSNEVRSSAAAALVRGPPATRHFGGNRGGLSPPDPADRNHLKRFGVGAIAICGAEKTVVYDHDQEPKGKTYPIGASGAVISDEMVNGEYLCCFLAKDKRMVVFELLTRTVVVELQMTTKLNFWRYLPPQAHGHSLVFMLITPVGGFHWVPLDESPRPIQVWKRGPALQGKKIVTYEEGGSNGFSGAEALSVVALLLVSTASTGTPLEAWIVQVGGESPALCVSENVLGAALFRPFYIQDEAFLPHLVTAMGVESEIVLKVEPLSQNPATGELAVEDVSIGAIIDQSQVRRVIYSPPALAMGGWPEVICCTCQGFVVACVRRKGLVAAYECQEELVLVQQEHVGSYIVDAALRPATENGDVELMLLLADTENPRDGFILSIDISR